MKHPRKYSLPVLIAGVLLLLGGLAGSASLYAVRQDYRHTTGTIRDFRREKVYRHRKIRYEYTMRISYPTHGYGEMQTTRKGYWPFGDKGDKIAVWYHPCRPHEIRLPATEGLLWGVLAAAGLICIYCGAAARKEDGKPN